MPSSRSAGFSLVEALVALALVASVSAVFVPALAGAARLQRESDAVTRAFLIAERRAELLRGTTPAAGRLLLDAEGRESAPASAVVECSWRPVPVDGVARVVALVIEVRTVPAQIALAQLALVVPDG